jgi:hypothetical protein
MFNDLDDTLRALLTDPAAPADLRAADVSFDTPAGDFRPAQATVNLFLHEVTENRELRDEARIISRTATRFTSRSPSLRVDCSYLATTWSSHTGGFKAQEEHRLLGLALLWLSRYPVIDESFLQGNLRNPPQPYPVPTAVARNKEGQVMGHFWSALGIPPRPAFSLTVTIAVEPFSEFEEFSKVRSIQLEETSVDHPVLAGRVLDSELAPVVNAIVFLLAEDGRVVSTQTSDGRGAFAFPDVQFAGYRLLARAAGHDDQERSVIYAQDRQVHNVILAGP